MQGLFVFPVQQWRTNVCFFSLTGYYCHGILNLTLGKRAGTVEEQYYAPCRELDLCNQLIQTYFLKEKYKECFDGHLPFAKAGYPLAECQIGYFYLEGLGTQRDLKQAHYWTRRAADHGDRDGQCNLAWFYEEGIGAEKDMEQAVFWYRKAAQQNHELALEKCRELGIEVHPVLPDREGIRKDLRCRILPLNTLEEYRYTVICSRYKDQWILSRHKLRDTWETQGGHIEAGETPMDCAQRELFEESGIQDADIYPLCDYWGFNDRNCSNGMVFLAVVHSIDALPESEMKEIRAFSALPENLTYPLVSPLLFAEAEKLLSTL